jgi:nitrite reductase/ring-hydroxylating ferredoxin subunit
MQDIAYAICRLADIPNRRARAFSLLRATAGSGPGGEPYHIVIVRWDRKIHGYVNRCPHHGTQLDWERDQFLEPNGDRLMCGKHGALFALDNGACVDGPCMGEGLEPVRLAILDGDICITGVTLVEDEAP